ncbi:hypothetical protein SADUNF_Sadunf01G0187700 [Salix dunnii]|uniref:Uncharacterized protein n=1 Tax=Salix dunnii TaxID=1413687 RepID=A0A835TL87_9ROSI|nr:hypothetical protein SADUNF_Sadunf01G0187700 [Salix dunnii]
MEDAVAATKSPSLFMYLWVLFNVFTFPLLLVEYWSWNLRENTESASSYISNNLNIPFERDGQMGFWFQLLYAALVDMS